MLNPLEISSENAKENEAFVATMSFAAAHDATVLVAHILPALKYVCSFDLFQDVLAHFIARYHRKLLVISKSAADSQAQLCDSVVFICKTTKLGLCSGIIK